MWIVGLGQFHMIQLTKGLKGTSSLLVSIQQFQQHLPLLINPPPSRYEEKVVGIYLSLADDNIQDYGTDSDWNPELYEYQKFSANVLFFCFHQP